MRLDEISSARGKESGNSPFDGGMFVKTGSNNAIDDIPAPILSKLLNIMKKNARIANSWYDFRQGSAKALVKEFPNLQVRNATKMVDASYMRLPMSLRNVVSKLRGLPVNRFSKNNQDVIMQLMRSSKNLSILDNEGFTMYRDAVLAQATKENLPITSWSSAIKYINSTEGQNSPAIRGLYAKLKKGKVLSRKNARPELGSSEEDQLVHAIEKSKNVLPDKEQFIDNLLKNTQKSPDSLNNQEQELNRILELLAKIKIPNKNTYKFAIKQRLAVHDTKSKKDAIQQHFNEIHHKIQYANKIIELTQDNPDEVKRQQKIVKKETRELNKFFNKHIDILQP